ncbi:MAG: hypothetical protein IKO35_03990 [Elusimicrobiaceae bacterium]|nr:hypothetical protein [Elusimicrobiaceae bacterium]
MKARVYWLGLALLCSACAAPSLRYKTDVNRLAYQGDFKSAAQLVADKRHKTYARHDRALAYLDEAALRHDAQDPLASDKLLAQAQERIEELYTVSASKSAARLLVNDLTLPYDVAPYERAFTYFYRAANFLDQNNLSEAAVEARRAAAYLDGLRGSKKKGYNDDPFVQYFASLIFESVGQRSDARICRENSLDAYARLGGLLRVSSPDFPVPSQDGEWGEVIVLHYNGLMPLKKTQTIQFSWSRILGILSSDQENRYGVSPEVNNALRAGFMGHAVTVAYPVLEIQPFTIVSSAVQANGQLYKLHKMADLAAAAQADLEEKLPGVWFRAALRAVAKQVAAEQARQAARHAAKDDLTGDLTGLFVNILGAATEKADTRQWFTLPAQIYMARLFLPPGVQNIRLLFRNGYGNIIGEHIFENVHVRKGGRVFLHYRTAK